MRPSHLHLENGVRLVLVGVFELRVLIFTQLTYLIALLLLRQFCPTPGNFVGSHSFERHLVHEVTAVLRSLLLTPAFTLVRPKELYPLSHARFLGLNTLFTYRSWIVWIRARRTRFTASLCVIREGIAIVLNSPLSSALLLVLRVAPS